MTIKFSAERMSNNYVHINIEDLETDVPFTIDHTVSIEHILALIQDLKSKRVAKEDVVVLKLAIHDLDGTPRSCTLHFEFENESEILKDLVKRFEEILLYT